ncbi:MAG: tetratricopeptide repeat protein [Verrucomicrobiales bacterium]|nr:tetratricopeptide repeat protein [Verrucomicrobiales bacterium]
MTTELFEMPMWRKLAAGLALTAMCATHQSIAQDEEEDLSVEGLYRKAGELLQNNQHEEASKVFEKMIDLSGGYRTLVEDYGAQAGGIMFDYAMTLLPQSRWADAEKAFQDCIDAAKIAKEIPSPLENNNPREKLAMFQLGFCKAQNGDHQAALELYDKYIASNPPQSELVQIRNGYTLRYGTSQMKLGQIEEGLATIQKLFDNREAWRVSPAFLAQGILEVGKVWNENAETAAADPAKRSKIESDALAFLDKNGSFMRMQPYDQLRFGVVDRLKALGFDASQAGMYSLAIRYLSMTPTSKQIKNDINSRVQMLRGVSGMPPQYAQSLELIEKKEAAEIPPDVEVMRLMASCYERIGNKMSPRSIYWHLTENYPSLPVDRRAEILHEAARFSAELRDYSSAQYFGEKFMDEMPEDHPLRNNVATFMIQSLFTNGDYETVIKIAEDVRSRYDIGDTKRELADALYPLALYSLRRHEDAKEPFDQYVKAYEDTPNREMVVYHRASNSLVLQEFRRSAEQIEDFMKEFPNSDKFVENALSDLSVARFNLEDYGAAITAANQLRELKPDSIQLGRTLNVRGDAYMVKHNEAEKEQEEESKEWRKEGLDSYLGALEAGQKGEATGKSPDYYKSVVAEAMWKAADIYIGDENCEEALKIYDRFFPSYAGTFWEPQISVFSLECLEQAGRVDEGLTQVEKMIVQEGNKDQDSQDLQLLREMIGSYSEASVRNRGAEETIKILDNFPGVSADNQILITWLKIQNVIILQEMQSGTEKDSPEYAQLKTRIDGIFQELSLFEKRNLSEYALQKIGEHLSKSSNPYTAKPFFEELLNRTNPEADPFKALADMEMGKLEMRESDPAILTSARERFRRVVDKYKDPDLTPEAWLQLGRLYTQREEWQDAVDAFDKINKAKSYFKKDRIKRAEATFGLGYAQEQLGDFANAAKAYIVVWSTYSAYPDFVSQAFERFVPLALKGLSELEAETELEKIAKREKEVEFYKTFTRQIYVWQKWTDEDVPSGALARLRRIDMKDKLGITLDEDTKVRFELGLPAPGETE